jgi:hypothetical protein
MIEGKIYEYMAVNGWLCLVYRQGIFIGSVHLDNSGVWNVKYQECVRYIPINSCLQLLGYNREEENTVEVE